MSPRVTILGLVAVVFCIASGNRAGATAPIADQCDGQVVLSRLPLAFERAAEQSGTSARYLVRSGGVAVLLDPSGLTFLLPPVQPVSEFGGRPEAALVRKALDRSRKGGIESLRMTLVGARKDMQPSGAEPLPGVSHYFLGDKRSEWRTNVPQFGRVLYRQVYPGIDLEFYGRNGVLEYDFVLAPGADPTQISLSWQGAIEMRLDTVGDLVIAVRDRQVVHRAPVAYQEVNGSRRAVAAQFAFISDRTVGFILGEHDPALPVRIDPVLAFATYLGGSGSESGGDVAIDKEGNIYVTGKTTSAAFPTTSPFQGTLGGGTDAFVAKITPTGDRLVYSTYLGGSSDESGSGIAVDAAGSAYVTGDTDSENFPVANAAQSTKGKWMKDAFVTKLSPAGDALVYSTYFGDNGLEFGFDIAVDGSGAAYIAGLVMNSFPCCYAPWVFKLPPAGKPHSYNIMVSFGGSGNNSAYGIAVDSTGSAYVTGSLQTTSFAPSDIFLLKLTPTGYTTKYGSLLHGSGDEWGTSIALDKNGNLLVTSTTSSTDMPIVKAIQSTNKGGKDGYLARVNPTCTQVLTSTYLGGSGDDTLSGVAVDTNGNVYLTGSTKSSDFPLSGAFQSTLGVGTCGTGPCSDAYVMKLDHAMSKIAYSSYLGGSGEDNGVEIAVDSAGNAAIIGTTSSANFPTFRPLQAAAGGGSDVFVAKVAAQPVPFTMADLVGQWTGTATNSQGAVALDLTVDSSGAVTGAAVDGTTWSIDDKGVVTGNGQLNAGGQSHTASWQLQESADRNSLSGAATTATAGVFNVTLARTLPCVLTCNATVPTTATVSTPVSFQGSATATNCGESPRFGWAFGDDSSSSTDQSPQHTYAATGTYTWTLTVAAGDKTCTKSGTIVVSEACVAPTITTQPTSQTVFSGSSASVSVIATGSGALSYQWYRGARGNTSNPVSGATSSTLVTPSLTATTSYWVRVRNSCGQVDSQTATITVEAAPAYVYIVPSVAHAPGSANTQWRTDVAAVNRGAVSATLRLSLRTSTTSVERIATLASGQTFEWSDIVVNLFGFDANASTKGTLLVGATAPVFISSRTFNQAATGTFGQYYPAVTIADTITVGRLGIIPQVKRNSQFRTNVGFVNAGQASCTLRVRVVGAGGSQVGGPLDLTVAGQTWVQQDNIVAAVGGSNLDIAYVTLEVVTPGGQVWAYASVVDNATGDPATIPVQVVSTAAAAPPGRESIAATEIVEVGPIRRPRRAPVGTLSAGRIGLPGFLWNSVPSPLHTVGEVSVSVVTDGFENFSSDTWDVYSSIDTTYWGATTYRAADGRFSLYCAGGGTNPAPGGGPYPASLETWVITGPFSLADAAAATVKYKRWLQTEQSVDYLYIMVSLDDDNYHGWRVSGASSLWSDDSLDLGSLTSIQVLGKPAVWFAFLFESDGMNQFEGVYVDQLRIEKTTSGTTCVAAAITTQPSSQAIQSGQMATLSVTATGTAPLGYQWYQGTAGDTMAPIPGATSLSFTTPSLTTTTSYWVRVSNACGSINSAAATVTVQPPPSYTYIVPSVAHASGLAGTQWRTDLGAVNPGTSTAAVELTFTSNTQTLTQTASLAASATTEWVDILVSLFGLSPTGADKGTVKVVSTVPLCMSSRTYNQAVTGTFGQYYPVLQRGAAIPAGKVGVIPQIKKNAGFRTNIGIANLGTEGCTVRIKLYNASGALVGETAALTAAAGRWLQRDDIFGFTGAGEQAIAYATIEVDTSGGLAWAYASVVDNSTGDPTTVPVLVQ